MSGFSKLLEERGIPKSLYTPIAYTSQIQEQSFAIELISKLCSSYPVHENPSPSFPEFTIAYICRSHKTLDEVAQEAWAFYFTLQKFSNESGEFLMLNNFLNENWNKETFLFYLKARKAIIQVKLGDSSKGTVELKDLMLGTNEWVSLVSKLFQETLKPTYCVQRMAARLVDADYSTEIPASVFIEFCVNEFREVKLKEINKSSMKKLNNVLLPSNGQNKPKLPARKNELPKNFNIMDYGKKQSKTLAKQPSVGSLKQIESVKNIEFSNKIVDEELEMATVEESPQSHEKPKYYSISMFSTDWEDQKRELEADLEDCQRDLEEVIIERDRIKEALEETIEFCDTVSYEHDLLIIQNSKLKKILSFVTDKLIRVDSKLIADIDFSEILNDPCKEFKPTGILKEKRDSKSFIPKFPEVESYEEIENAQYDSKKKTSESDKENKRRNIPPTPKFTFENEEFPKEIYTTLVDYNPSQSGLLNMVKGDRIQKISEHEDWFFGENLQTGDKGFFPPNFVSTQ
ncbi:unnamed protein product [Blepharisma stoltei]|uniref:SH3 domain-containing protein n=1 Tax=Blepharisma stoltei TaxID=1481888 RepID=A0AAU9JFS7_9CILI|nr:unnamed protein product [Blepharisma stoltei]